MDPEKKEKIHRLVERVLEEPIIVSISVLIVLSLIVVGLSFPLYMSETHEFFVNILAEAHGMIFDIAVIGILIFWLTGVGQKRQRIRAYKDEIDDFRMWESEEAAFRTVGNIKRLNRHKIFNIDLVNCHLSKTNLNYVVLKGANLNNANISNSNLIQANLENAFLIKADFNNAFLMEANLNGANLTGTNFDFANLYKADLRNAVGLTVEQFEHVKTLYLAEFDEDFYQKIRKAKPKLVGK